MLTDREIAKIRGLLKKTAKDRWVVLFDALGDKTRYGIFELLVAKQDICVTDIAKIFNLSIPAISQQLRILESSGLVEKERKGQIVCYKVNKKSPLVKSVIKLIT